MIETDGETLITLKDVVVNCILPIVVLGGGALLLNRILKKGGWIGEKTYPHVSSVTVHNPDYKYNPHTSKQLQIIALAHDPKKAVEMYEAAEAKLKTLPLLENHPEMEWPFWPYQGDTLPSENPPSDNGGAPGSNMFDLLERFNKKFWERRSKR